MERDVEAMVKLGLLVSLIDFDGHESEAKAIVDLANSIAAENPTVINGEDITSEIVEEVIMGFVDEWFEILKTGSPEVISQTTADILTSEAKCITDKRMRKITLKFCCIVGSADGIFEDIERLTIQGIHETWAGMNDGWDYDFIGALESAGVKVVEPK